MTITQEQFIEAMNYAMGYMIATITLCSFFCGMAWGAGVWIGNNLLDDVFTWLKRKWDNRKGGDQ